MSTVGGSLSSFEYPSPEVIECPYPFYRALRDDEPVHRLPNGDFVISRWEDIVYVVRNPEIFSSLVGPTNEHVLGGPRVGGDESGPWQLSFSDDPAHARNRTLNRPLFTRERLGRYEPVIREFADGLIDAFAERGEAELVSEFATQLPRLVIFEILGIPREDVDLLRSWLSGGQGPRGTRLATPEELAVELANTDNLRDYVHALIVERLETPGDDYLSELAQAQVQRDGEPDLPYLVTEGVSLLGAAIGTTANFIANTLILLLEHPEHMPGLVDDPTRLRAVLEESLRTESPVQWSGRITAVETELHGVTIPAGSNILLMWAAANRDERKFDDPERFWVGRPDVAKHHVGFGHGIHKCIGAPLARLECQISVEQLLSRLPGLELSDSYDGKHATRINVRSPATIPVVFNAG